VIDNTITFPKNFVCCRNASVCSLGASTEEIRPTSLDLQGLLEALMARLSARGEAWEWLTHVKK
jgi:hypothetical protein